MRDHLDRIAVGAVVLSALAGCSDGREVVQTDWWLAEPPDGRILAVEAFIGSSSCNRFSDVEVTERSDEVVVIVSVRTLGDPDVDCTADYTTHLAEVTTSEPLGDRMLSGCVAPESGHRDPDLEHNEGVDCRVRQPSWLTDD